MVAAIPDDELVVHLLGRNISGLPALQDLLELQFDELMRLGLSGAEAKRIEVVAEIARRHQPRADRCSLMEPEDVVSRVLDLRRTQVAKMLALVIDGSGHAAPPLVVAEGQRGCAAIDPRSLAQLVVTNGGLAVIVVHNHFSGAAVPTRTDLRFTSALERACGQRNIELTDHIIVTPRSWFSFRQHRAVEASCPPSLNAVRT